MVFSQYLNFNRQIAAFNLNVPFLRNSLNIFRKIDLNLRCEVLLNNYSKLINRNSPFYTCINFTFIYLGLFFVGFLNLSGDVGCLLGTSRSGREFLRLMYLLFSLLKEEDSFVFLTGLACRSS